METPWHAQKWVIIAALVLFFPLGIYLMWKHKAWSQQTMALVTVSVIALFLLIAIINSVTGSDGSDDAQVATNASPTPASTIGAASTATGEPPASTPTTRPAPSATLATATQDVASATIPSLTADYFVGELEQGGFACNGPRQLQTVISWTCTLDLLYVDALGTSPTSIQRISATATGASDETATTFLGIIANFPYDTARPEATIWVEDNITAGFAERVFDGIRFTVSGDPGTRSLDIVALGAPQ